MKMPRLLISLLLLASLTGCASVSLVDSWKDQQAQKKTYRDILVVGITKDRQTRQIFEEVMVAELKGSGVSATPSYTITGIEEQLSRALIEKAVQKTSVSAVITTRMIDLKNKSHTAVGYEMTNRGFDSYVDWYGMGTVSYATFDMKPVEVTTSSTYALQANFFDSATQKLVWIGTTNTVDPKGLITASREYAGVIINTMRKEGLLP